MVGIAQLAERLVVVQEVAGSSPVTHPKFTLTSGARRALGGPLGGPLAVHSRERHNGGRDSPTSSHTHGR